MLASQRPIQLKACWKSGDSLITVLIRRSICRPFRLSQNKKNYGNHTSLLLDYINIIIAACTRSILHNIILSHTYTLMSSLRRSSGKTWSSTFSASSARSRINETTTKNTQTVVTSYNIIVLGVRLFIAQKNERTITLG